MPPSDFFGAEFYRDDSAEKPVASVLRACWLRTNPWLAARAKEELRQLRQARFRGLADTKAIRGQGYRGLYELRVRGHADARLIYFYESDRRIIVVHAFEKKTQKMPRADLDLAHERRRRHLERRSEGRT